MSRDVRRAKSKPRYCYRCDVMCTAHDSSCLQDFGHEAAGKVQKGCSDGKTQNVLRCATNTCFFFDSQTRQCHKVCTLGGAGRLIYSMSLWTACAGLSCHSRVGPKLVLKQFDSLNSRTVDHVSKDRGIYSTSSGANRQSTMHEAINYHHFSLCKFSTELSCIACRTLGRSRASLQWRRRSPRRTGFHLAKRWMGSSFSGSGNSTEASSWP